MVRLYLFGAPELRRHSETSASSDLAQPKPTALLAYLAMSGARRVHRRDQLLALFWPELDDARARRALNQALYYLRGLVGDDAIQRRGNEEISVSPLDLWCDVVAFEAALDANDLEGAMALYRGHLLEGFHVSGLADFERWLDDERARLKQRAAQAAGQRAAQTEGSVAIEWARRAFTISRDEGALRRLVAMQDQAGDRTGALRDYEKFARELEEELGVKPSPETEQLVATIRARRLSLHSGALATPATPEARTNTNTARTDTNQLIGQQPGRRFRPRIAALAVLLLAALGWTADRVLKSRAEAPIAAATVAVFPFVYRGDPQHAYASDAIRSLLSTNIEGVAGMRTLDERMVAGVVRSLPNGGVARSDAARIAKEFGAHLFILGDVTESGGRVRVTAAVHDAERRSSEPAQVTLDGTPDSLFDLADQLSAKLLAARSAGPSAELYRSAMLTTQSATALRAYLAGESEYRLGRYSAAVQQFRRAVEADSSFALAYYRVSNAADWTGEWDLATWASAEAVKRVGRLTRLDRMRVEAWDFHLRGHAGDAARLYRAILAEDSTDVETRLNAADIEFHWGGLFGRPTADSRGEWERALAHDPSNSNGLLHLVRLLAMERQRDLFDRYAAQLERLNLDGDRAAELGALRAFTFGTTAQRKTATEALGSITPAVAWSIVWSVAGASYDLSDVAELLMPVMLDRHSFTSREAGHMAMRASIELARGRVRAADNTLDSMVALGAGHALAYRAALAVLPVPGTAKAQLRALRDTLTRLPSQMSTNRALAIRIIYLLGVLSVRLGDDTGAVRYQAQLERPLPIYGSADSGFSRKFARQVQAERLRAAEKYAEALALLGEPTIEPDGRRPNVWSYPRAHERLLRAELLADMGRTAESLRWYATFPDPSAYDVALLPVAELRQAELFEKLGRREQALAHYERFLALWNGADRELAPFVAQIRKKLPD